MFYTDDSAMKQILKMALRIFVTLLVIIVGLISILYADYRYKLNKYGEAPIEIREIECVDVRSYKNGDLFIFQDTTGKRYKCRGIDGIIKGDKTTIRIKGDNINYGYSYTIEDNFAEVY